MKCALSIILFVLLCCLGCSSNTQRGLKQQSHLSGKNIQAILLSESKEWNRKQPLTFLFAIYNGTPNTVCFDGRMAYSGNIDILFEGSDLKIKRAMTIIVNLTQPSKGDLIHLESHRLFGTELSIDPNQNNGLFRELRGITRGHYKFWATYYGREVRSLGCSEISLTSNVLEVVVE